MDALDIWNGFNIVESCIISICSAFSELASWPYSQSPASSRPEILKEADCSSMSAYISIGTTTNSPAQKNRVFMKAYFFTVFCTKNRGMKTIWPSPPPPNTLWKFDRKRCLSFGHCPNWGWGLCQNRGCQPKYSGNTQNERVFLGNLCLGYLMFLTTSNLV